MKGKRLYSALLSILLLLSTISTTGCWDRVELSNIAIVLGLGIDKQGKDYRVSIQAVNPASLQESSQFSPVTVFTQTGSTLTEAIKNIYSKTPRVLHFSHLEIIVLSEEVARTELLNVINFMLRNNGFRADSNLIVSKGCKALDVLNQMTALEPLPADSLFDSLKLLEEQIGFSAMQKLNNVVRNLGEGQRDLLVAGVEIQGNKRKGTDPTHTVNRIWQASMLTYTNMAVFRDAKLVGWLNFDEMRDATYVIRKPVHTVEEVQDTKGGTVTCVINNPHVEVDGSFEKGKPKISIEVSAKATVVEDRGILDFTDEATIDRLQVELEKEITTSIRRSIKEISKKYKSDIFGFGTILWRESPDEWKKIEKNWDQQLPNLQLDIKVDASIMSTGQMDNVLPPSNQPNSQSPGGQSS